MLNYTIGLSRYCGSLHEDRNPGDWLDICTTLWSGMSHPKYDFHGGLADSILPCSLPQDTLIITYKQNHIIRILTVTQTLKKRMKQDCQMQKQRHQAILASIRCYIITKIINIYMLTYTEKLLWQRLQPAVEFIPRSIQKDNKTWILIRSMKVWGDHWVLVSDSLLEYNQQRYLKLSKEKKVV